MMMESYYLLSHFDLLVEYAAVECLSSMVVCGVDVSSGVTPVLSTLLPLEKYPIIPKKPATSSENVTMETSKNTKHTMPVPNGI